MTIRTIFLSLFIIFLSCESSEPFIKVSMVGPAEFELAISNLTPSLFYYLRAQNIKPLVQINKIRNKTAQHINTHIIHHSLVNKLLKNNIAIYHTNSPDAAVRKNQTSLRKPDFSLYGDINEDRKQVREFDKKLKRQVNREYIYTIITLKLDNNAKNQTVWIKQQKFLEVKNLGRKFSF